MKKCAVELSGNQIPTQRIQTLEFVQSNGVGQSIISVIEENREEIDLELIFVNFLQYDMIIIHKSTIYYILGRILSFTHRYKNEPFFL